MEKWCLSNFNVINLTDSQTMITVSPKRKLFISPDSWFNFFKKKYCVLSSFIHLPAYERRHRTRSSMYTVEVRVCIV